MIPRRGLLALAALAALRAPAGAAAPPAPAIAPRPLVFPRDHGAHPEARIEWWYATGWLHDAQAAATPAFGFQLTFFRSRTGLAATVPSRFAARQLLFAHAALTDLAGRRLAHAERIARWSGDERSPRAAASQADTRVHIGPWRLQRDADGATESVYRATLGDAAAGFAYRLALATTQPLLLQGDAGYSRKGPDTAQASHYYTQPQLAVSGELQHGGREAGVRAVRGLAWLDHEWSESLLPAGAVGWDWIGINLADGGALTAFRLRRADGSAVWAGGSHRASQRRDARVRRRRSDLRAARPLEQRRPRAPATRCAGACARRSARSSWARCSRPRNSTAAPAPARCTGKAWPNCLTARAADSASVTSK